MYGGMKRIKEINYIFVLNFCGVLKIVLYTYA